MTREEAAKVAIAIVGAQVKAAIPCAGVLVLELFHRGTDDDAYRLAISISGVTADAWPWPSPAQEQLPL